MIQEVLHNCHVSIEGGPQGVVSSYQRVKHDYDWIGLYSDAKKDVKSCFDCTSSKSLPQLKGYSPGNVLAKRPFQVVSMDFVIALPSMDFVIALPTSRRGNTALLLWQDSFIGFVIAKAMSDTDALTVAKVNAYTGDFVLRLLFVTTVTGFMIQVFQTFSERIQAWSMSTPSYRPQANGQQKRSVKIVMRSVYVEGPLQQD
ncbi:LOW QUALITY PROTEIN: reverse transcriptase [Phytophthora megakarya]|uniref:Reverse transcriptase n=1 Tax=Phytophthora megakarya TaxID=4795 RepID=A0A225W7T9_9STRA|nr:LOW QUALITY PROTEIN: reverse transcriptase [Phytophthora megakarya]